MLNNLLNAHGFGQRIVSNGEPQFVVMQLAENLFVTTDDGAELPATLKLSRADLARPPGRIEPTKPPPVSPELPGEEETPQL